jgi:serine/threonine protein kinase
MSEYPPPDIFKNIEQERPKVEILHKYLESASDDQLLTCLERNRERAEPIGFGLNATVYGVEDEIIGHLCVKEINEFPQIKYNDPTDEFDFQERLNAGGVRTPYTIAELRDEKGKAFIIMEKINGHSIGDTVEKNLPLPKGFNLNSFHKKLAEQVKKMHEMTILHRDLHKGNVMIDENGDPVIIDFGLATNNSASSNDAYQGEVQTYNKNTGRYSPTTGLLLNDEKQVNLLKAELRTYIADGIKKGIFTNSDNLL